MKNKCRDMKAGDTVFVRGESMGTLSRDAEVELIEGVEMFAILHFTSGHRHQCNPQQELETTS